MIFLQWYNSFLLLFRSSWSRPFCSSVFWLQFWMDDHGQQGGEIWTYLGLRVRITCRTLRYPCLVVKSYPLCNPRDNALPPAARMASVSGLSSGAQTSRKSSFEPRTTSRSSLTPRLSSSWRCAEIWCFSCSLRKNSEAVGGSSMMKQLSWLSLSSTVWLTW